MNSFNTIPPQPFPPSSSEDGMQGAAIKKLQNDVSGLKTDVLQLSNTKANQSNIAPSFNAETSYTVGDYVTYEGQTYKCTTDHTGAWNADNFTETTVATELNGLNSKITGLVKQGSVSITVANGTSTGSAYLTVDTVRITRNRMIGVLIGKNDDVYYTPVIASVNTDGAIELRVIAATPPDTDRTYNIIVSYI